MPQVIPFIGPALGIINTIQGLRASGQQQRAIGQAQGITEEQRAELAKLMAILSNPNDPTRGILRGQAEAGIARQVTGGGQQAIAQLAASGLRSPETAASVLGRLGGAGVAAQGDLERQLINDFIQKRVALVGGPQVALAGGLSLAQLTGQQATSSGEALGNLLALLTRQRQAGGGVFGQGVGPYWGAGTVQGYQGYPRFGAGGSRPKFF